MQGHRSVNQQHPTPAMILTGGRGDRLKPLADTRPKPTVEIFGASFVAYQIKQLLDQGFEKILLLLGYLPEVIHEYFGVGRRWGVEIGYSVSAADDENAGRLKLADPRLGPYFLQLYCDNCWPPMEN
jgi:NDP-sugar pyrophosphorylase family protein